MRSFDVYLENGLLITMGNHLLQRLIPTQQLIESRYKEILENCSGDVETYTGKVFTPKEWCNLMWVYQEMTGLQPRIDDKNSALESMKKHFNLGESFSFGLTSTEYVESIRKVMKKMAEVAHITFKPTCSVAKHAHDTSSGGTGLNTLKYSYEKYPRVSSAASRDDSDSDDSDAA